MGISEEAGMDVAKRLVDSGTVPEDAFEIVDRDVLHFNPWSSISITDDVKQTVRDLRDNKWGNHQDASDKALMAKYRKLTGSKSLEEALGCTTHEIQYDDFLTSVLIRQRFIEAPALTQYPVEKLLEQIHLVSGIGPRAAVEYRRAGYRTMRDLDTLPDVAPYAAQARSKLQHAGPGEVLPWLEEVTGRRSGEEALRWALSRDPARILFLSGVCMNLRGMPIAFTVGRIAPEGLLLESAFLTDAGDEEAFFDWLLSHVHTSDVVLTYTGFSSEWSILETRGEQCHIEDYPEHPPNIDVMRILDRYRPDLPSKHLAHVARELLGLERNLSVHFGAVTEWYQTWRKEQHPGLVVGIVQHVEDNVEALYRLVTVLRNELEADP